MYIKKEFSEKELKKLQWKIKRGKFKNFYTTSYLGSNLADIFFIHNNQIFNCAIMSLKGNYMEEVSSIVYDKVIQLYPKYYDFEWIPCTTKGHEDCHEIKHTHKYNEKDVDDYKERITKEVCSSGEVQVRERIEIDSSYEYGIGIAFYFDVDTIDEELCNKAIKIIQDCPVLYDGIIYLSEDKTFKYKDCKKHNMLGCAIDI